MTGALALTLGRPGADAKPFREREFARDVHPTNPPDFIVNKPSSNPGITVHESNSPEPTQSTTRICSLALVQAVIEDASLVVHGDVIHDDLEPDRRFHAVTHDDILVPQSTLRGHHLRLLELLQTRRTSTLTSTSSGTESADAGAAVVIAHAIAHHHARATFSLASSIHDVEFARAVTVRRARRPRRRVRARRRRRPRSHRRRRSRVRVIVLDVVPRARVANTDVRRSSFATEIESRRRVVVSRDHRSTDVVPTTIAIRTHPRTATNEYVRLSPLCTECPIFSLSVLHHAPPARDEERRRTKNEKKRKKTKKTDDTDETKRNGRKRSGWDDDLSRARGEGKSRALARARWRACEGRRDTWREGGDEQGPVRTRARTVREVTSARVGT